MGFRGQEDFQTVLRAGGETGATQGSVQDSLELEGDPGLKLLTEEEIAAVTFCISFRQHCLYY
jgi:hypothetical protein